MAKRSTASSIFLVLAVFNGLLQGIQCRRSYPSHGYNNDDDDMGGGVGAGAGAGGNRGGGHDDSPTPLTDTKAERALLIGKGIEMLRYMNASADPCKDFYEYACGNWISEYQQKLTEEAKKQELARNDTSVQKEIERKVNNDLQKLLEQRPRRDDAKSVIKVKHFYRTCMSAVRGSTNHLNFLVEFAKRYGGLPGVPRTRWANEQSKWIQQIATLRYMYGMDILIGLEIDRDMEQTHRRSIYITEPKDSLIPMELCNEENIRNGDIRDESYETIKREVTENMKNWFAITEHKANVFASEIVRFEFELCKGMRTLRSEDSETREQDQQTPRMRRKSGRAVRSRTGLNRVHGGRNGKMGLVQLNQKFENNIDFKLFVDTSLNTSMNDPVYLRSEPYFTHLKNLLRQSSRPTMANYIMYRALLQFHMPNDKDSMARAPYCADLSVKYFPRIVGDIYTRHFPRQEAKSNLANIFSMMVDTFREAVRNDWLHDMDTSAYQQKLSQIQLKFPAYMNLETNSLHMDANSDFWHTLEAVMQYNADEERNNLQNGYTADDSNNGVESPEVQIKFMPATLEIVSGLGLLQPPLYDNIYGKSLKFSVIGQWIAQALSTAFDEQGWRSNPASEARWRQYTVEGFRNRSECFRKQYSNYLHNNPDEFHNASKLREIMADGSGLNIAFKAYLNWLATMEPRQNFALVKETLPGVNYSNTQLFFIHFAQSRCAARRDEQWPPEFLPLDRHTTERYNVNGHLANNEEFAREFGCSAGSNMNPPDKCSLY